MTFPKTFTTNNFIERPDGQFKATIPASTHGLGINYRVTKTSDEAFAGYVILV